MATAPKKILIVEDDGQVRRVVLLALRSAGFDVLEADTSDLAYATARAHSPDLVLTDVGLAVGDGCRLVETLRKDGVDSAILVMTGDSNPMITARLLKMGIAVLHKPFQLDELLAVVAAALKDAKRD